MCSLAYGIWESYGYCSSTLCMATRDLIGEYWKILCECCKIRSLISTVPYHISYQQEYVCEITGAMYKINIYTRSQSNLSGGISSFDTCLMVNLYMHQEYGIIHPITLNDVDIFAVVCVQCHLLFYGSNL